MSLEIEIQKTVTAAVERAMETKGPHNLPILALLVGAPMIKSPHATLVDALLGMLVGSMIDRGDSDEKIRGKLEETLRGIRSAIADPETIARSKRLVAAMDDHRNGTVR